MTSRRIYSAAELSHWQPRPVRWPAVSIALLSVFAVAAPAGLLTAMNLYLLALAGLVFLASRQPLERPLIAAVLPFVAAIVIGLLGGIGSDRYLYLKDAWYYANPGIVLAMGFVLARALGDTRRGLRAFVIGGTLIAVLHLLWFVIHPELLLRRATQIREVTGTGYQASAVAVIVLLGYRGRWKESLGLSQGAGLACLLLCALSAALSFSRTLTLVIVLGWLAMAGFFARRELLRVGSLLFGLLAIVVTLQASVDTQSLEAKHSFVGKLARSFEELQVDERMTIREINENWRGFETARAIATWRNGEALQQVFGLGFGTQVDLGLFQNLSGRQRDAVRFIPIFHNGYVYVLLKTGVAGVLLYLFALFTLYRTGRRTAADASQPDAAREGRLLQACAVVLLTTTWVVSGAFSKFDMFPFLLMSGFLLAARHPR